ncbi:N-acetylmuramoyl-L-alanine amidase [Microcoleus sp. FACHB-SPT15]|uniref:peptidoglycan recognition protein family protein n=1 Tax=Microcoleus sp. FACHB-SPT15 TaxID=2692830 RepID=UPI00178173E6|nr:N-acetylmuramoyl-L-alanine amidase [Microcoleus sp. FACHB-SPT15]MBD1806700.1 N-acetylmuramoyl-L-alanine amidase [Microcoleus sp. FACHB-SPT15]
MSFTASVITAKDWGAKPPKQWSEITRPQYIIIHHTATPNPPNDASKGTLTGAKEFAKSVQKAHMDGFGWVDSGHNFLNTTSGFLLEGRQGSLAAIVQGRSVRSAHAGNTKGNESPGIENEGTFTTYQMKALQWNSLVELCASICSSCKISPDNIRGHRDFSPTQCPGDWLYSQLPRLRNEVRQRIDASVEDYLREGSTGTKVKELQQLLKAKGFNPGPIDGIFGSGTVQAVVSFQKFNGLKADGVVGPATWQALSVVPVLPESPPATLSLIDTYKYYRGLPHQDQAIAWLQGQVSKQVLEEFSQKWRDTPSQPFLPLQRGAVGPEVKQLQQRLQQQGFNPGVADGIFGAATQTAVIAFQKAKGISPDGIVGEKTWTTLNLS